MVASDWGSFETLIGVGLAWTGGPWWDRASAWNTTFHQNETAPKSGCGPPDCAKLKKTVCNIKKTFSKLNKN